MKSNQSDNNSSQEASRKKRADSLAILGLVLLGTGMLPDIAIAFDSEAQAKESQNANAKLNSSQAVSKGSSNLLAQTNQQNDQTRKEHEAYASSGYTYWDALVLSKFWNQNLGDTKARMGRKVLWGAKDRATLEQYLLDGRIKALGNVNNSLSFYPETSFQYKDVEALAKFWGDPSPYDTKVRIERNLIMGNEKIVNQALEFAKQKN